MWIRMQTDKALSIINNAKTVVLLFVMHGVLLVHENKAASILPRLDQMLVANVKAGLETIQFRLDSKAKPVCFRSSSWDPRLWHRVLDYVLAVKVVSSLDGCALNPSAPIIRMLLWRGKCWSCSMLLDQVDSAAVYVNASTRFTDGGQFGLGWRMRISTQKLRAWSMGLKERLTSYKYVVAGDGQIKGVRDEDWIYRFGNIDCFKQQNLSCRLGRQINSPCQSIVKLR